MSNQPPEYTRQYNFENFQAINPTTPLPGNKVEAELNAARSSINQTISRLNEIQNADGSLKYPGALNTETTATATSVATSVATTTAQAYLAANYDPTVATQAAASASDAASWATDAANSQQLAQANMSNAEAAAGLAQNAAIDAAIARSEARSHAIDANESRNEAHASAQAAAASYADVGQVYGSALSLKNWIDSQSYQFVHKREDTTSVAANMLFNEGDVSNTLIGHIFKNASFDANSNVTYPTPSNNGYNFLNGPWWIVGNPAPENPEVIILRDMMNCMVQTWKTFGPTVARGEIKPMEPGVNGAPGPEWGQLNVPGPAFIKPIIYSASEFNTNQLSYAGIQRAALTPKGYVDYEINRVQGLANQAQSTANVARQEVVNAKIAVYDNGRTYNEGDIVYLNGKIYWFNTYIGGAGYGPVTHPAAWTELSSSTDLTGYATENFVTSQGYLTSVPSGYATQSFVNSKPGLINLEYSLNYIDMTSPSYTDTPVGVVDAQAGFVYYNITITSPVDKSISNYAGYTVQFVAEAGANGISIDNVSRTVTFKVNTMLNNTQDVLSDLNIAHGWLGWHFGGALSTAYYVQPTELAGKSFTLYPSLLQMQQSDRFVNAKNIFNDFTESLNSFVLPNRLIGTDQNGRTMFYQSLDFARESQVAKINGTTFTGKVNTVAPTSSNAGLNIGTINSTANLTNSVPGDVWIGTWQMAYKTANGTLVYGAATNASNVFGSPQVIDTTSNTLPGLRVTQKGTQPCLVVEDSLNPDATALVVDTSGNVGIGVAAGYSATSKLEVVGNVKATTLSTGSGPTFSLNSTAAHTGGTDTLDAIVTINGVNYRIGLRPA